MVDLIPTREEFVDGLPYVTLTFAVALLFTAPATFAVAGIVVAFGVQGYFGKAHNFIKSIATSFDQSN